MNRNAYYSGGHLTKIIGFMKNIRVMDLLVHKLNQLDLHLDKNIVRSMADAVSVLLKFSKDRSPVRIQMSQSWVASSGMCCNDDEHDDEKESVKKITVNRKFYVIIIMIL